MPSVLQIETDCVGVHVDEDRQVFEKGNNGRFVASRPREKAKTLVSGRFRVTDEVDYFRMAKINRPNLFAPCFSAKRPKIKQFGRLISA